MSKSASSKKNPAKPAVKSASKAKAPAAAKPKAAAKAHAEPAKAAPAPAPAPRKPAGGAKPPAPAPVEPDPETKARLLNARKRKGTPAIFKIRSRKNTPIVFTLDDVREIIKNRKEKKGLTPPPAPLVPVAVEKTPAKPKFKDTPALGKPRKARILGAASVADILGVASPPRTQKPVSVAQMMDDEKIPQKWRKYYKQLVQMREEIRQGLDLHTQETLKRSAKEDSGDLSGYSQHLADAGTDTFDRDFALSLVSSEQELLFEIEEALKRIRDGTYGVCEITQQPIAPERLAAVPFTRYSLQGQKELEKQRRFGGSRTGTPVAFGDATQEDAAALAEDDAEA